MLIQPESHWVIYHSLTMSVLWEQVYLFFVTKLKNVLDWFRSDRWHAPDCVQNNLVVTLSKWSEYAYLDQSDWIIMIHFTVAKISFPRTAPCGFILQTRLEKMLHCSYTWQLYFPVFNFAKLKRNSGSCLSHKTLLGLSPGKFFHYNVPKECKKKKMNKENTVIWINNHVH